MEKLFCEQDGNCWHPGGIIGTIRLCLANWDSPCIRFIGYYQRDNIDAKSEYGKLRDKYYPGIVFDRV